MDCRPLVTVYVPSHAYGEFLPRAMESLFAQILQDWEAIIVDDGSTDETAEVAERYRQRDPQRVKVVRNDEPRGLQYNANVAIEMARGKYVMRLDADDWLDESALLVMSQYLEQHPDCALVYPNYFYVDHEGNYLGVEHRKKIGRDADLLDLPAHGACTMVRKRVLKVIGGYDENHNAQDGYELWLKVLDHYPVANVETPLFYYRQHPTSLSTDQTRILTARQEIKRSLLESRQRGEVSPRIVAVIPAKNTYSKLPNVALREVAGRPLIDWTLHCAFAAEVFDHVVVTTDDDTVVEHCRDFDERILPIVRPDTLSDADRRLSEVLYDCVGRLESDHDVFPDIVVLLSAHAPLRRPCYIRQAIDTLALYDADSVISVYEDYDLHFRHGKNGLETLNPGMLRRLRLERESLYVFNGAIHAAWRDVLTPEDHYGQRISHVVTPREESFQIKSGFDRELVEFLMHTQTGY